MGKPWERDWSGETATDSPSEGATPKPWERDWSGGETPAAPAAKPQSMLSSMYSLPLNVLQKEADAVAPYGKAALGLLAPAANAFDYFGKPGRRAVGAVTEGKDPIEAVIHGEETPEGSELAAKLGAPDKALSDALPFLYGDGRLKKRGILDPTLRGVLGFGIETATNPLSYVFPEMAEAGKGLVKHSTEFAKAVPTAFMENLPQGLVSPAQKAGKIARLAGSEFIPDKVKDLLEKTKAILTEEGTGAEGATEKGLLNEQAQAAPRSGTGPGIGIGPQANAGAVPQNPGPLKGLYKTSPGPTQEVRDAARGYAEARGLPPIPHTEYVDVDPKRGASIARAFEEMAHDPHNPEVKAAYSALIDETMQQWQLMKKMGIKVDLIEPGMPNPYPGGSADMIKDVRNKHLWVFPTESGFGSGNIADHPLMAPTGETLNGRPLVANDIFRAVHDVFGHAKEGVGFGPRGEENAWVSHSGMYSDLARRAMTTETRGQNSWVNFGPKGAANQANKAATTYAEQKAGLLPDWVTWDGLNANQGLVKNPNAGKDPFFGKKKK